VPVKIPVILGVILFIAGVEPALVIKDFRLKRDNLFVLLVTGRIVMWNMGAAYLAGCASLLRP
jgi:hypothetical protein